MIATVLFHWIINRILLEQSGNHRRVEVGTNPYDQPLLEIDYPAITVIEAHAVLGRCKRTKLDYRLVVFDNQMLHVELCSLGKHSTQFRECAGDEVLLAVVMTCERMRAHDGPIDVFSYNFEKSSSVALFESLEDFSNTFGCDFHFELDSSLTWS
jgi:hypothetical protein